MKKGTILAGLGGAALAMAAGAVVSYLRHRKELDERCSTMAFMDAMSPEDAAEYKDTVIKDALLRAAAELSLVGEEPVDGFAQSDFDISDRAMTVATCMMRGCCKYDGMGGWDIQAAQLYSIAKDMLDGAFDYRPVDLGQVFDGAGTDGAAELTQEEADRITDEFFSFKEGDGVDAQAAAVDPEAGAQA